MKFIEGRIKFNKRFFTVVLLTGLTPSIFMFLVDFIDGNPGTNLIGQKVTQEWAFDVQNVTNQQNVFSKTYDHDEREIATVYQLGLFSIVQYRIYF